ncbi:MAG: NAD-dependent succinate-semialdehyde dehydrogenase [Candidatus Berkiellales bacterium]
MENLRNPNLFKEACYINGKWMESKSGKTIPVINPFNGNQIGKVPECAQAETQYALESANQAWNDWKNRSAKERSDILWAWAHLIDQNKDDLALIMTLEQGKPLTESLGEINYANGFIKWFAEECRRIYGDVIPSNKPNQHLVVIKQPIGVVAAITPWNFPAAMITRKVAPALAVGCTVVIKPDKATPFSAFALAQLADEAGIPPGVLNVLTGLSDVIGLEMTTNPIVRKFSFTGSTKTGSLLMKQCASTIKNVTLELGGNAPFIVFNDADLDAAVEGAIASKFRNTGQTCVCANRILVQNDIYDAFTDKFVSAVSKLIVGNGLEKGVQQGPLINQAALEKVKRHIADAVEKKGKILCGGKPHSLGGLFFEPTVISDANSTMLLAKEETFGPVAPLFRFHTDKEAVQLSNDTEFGLAAYFYGKDIDRIWHVAEELEYGMIGINTGILSTEVAPFGGVKQSGIGREGSKYGVESYLEIKYLCMQNR